jgi:phage gpG-like protein
MRVSELPGYLKGFKNRIASAAGPSATEMAHAVKDRMVSVTLRETVHAPDTFYEAVAGRPPAFASGRLAGSVFVMPSSGMVFAKANVGVSAKYAAIQEWGGWTVPNDSEFMHWHNPRVWYKKRVTLPEHPYFRPTVKSMIDDGSLSKAAANAFYDRIRVFYTYG